MKKSIIVMMVAVLLVSALFVSCKQEIATPEDRLGTVSIALPSSRALEVGTPTSISTVTKWYYVATKVSGYYDTGKTDWGTLSAMTTGTHVNESGFSAGDWLFSFYGFAGEATEDEKADAIYFAEDIPLTVVRSQENPIDVVLQGGGGIGPAEVVFSGLKFVEGETEYTLPGDYTLRINGLDVSELPYTIEVQTAGKYTYTVGVYKNGEKLGEASVEVQVNKGYRYPITGTINAQDSLGLVVIGQVGYDRGMSEAVAAVANQPTELTVQKVAPLAGSNTTASFAANALEVGSNYVLETSVKGIEEASFVVAEGNVAVASIDLTLYENGAQTTVSGKTVTVTTYIAKGMSDVVLTYEDPTKDQPVASDNTEEIAAHKAHILTQEEYEEGTKLGYYPTTGLLRFTTSHFSRFDVESSSSAYIAETNTAYPTLKAAVTDATAGQVIKLLKDDNSISGQISKNIIIDMGGYTMTGSFDVKGGKVTLKNGIYHESAASYIYGKGTETVSYSALTIEKDATVIAADGNCGFVLWPTGANGYGVEMNVYGEISAPENGAGIFVSGNCKAGNSVINVYGEIVGDALGIALNGFATLNVFDGAKITGNLETAIEVRAGNLNISGGTFTSNSETDPVVSHSNGSGTTTEGAALAIAQHTTVLPINVNITGGKFTGNAGLFQTCPETNSDPSVINVTLTGGEFSSRLTGGYAIYVQNGNRATLSQGVINAAVGQIYLGE